MGKALNGKELGEGIYQQPNGTYCARFVDRFGKRRSKRSKKLQEVRQWLADSIYIDQHSDIDKGGDILVDALYEQWIEMKSKTVTYHTWRNYRYLYRDHIKPFIGNKLVSQIKPMHCQKILMEMGAKGYKNSTLQLLKITMHSLFDFAIENYVLTTNPCSKSVKTNVGEESEERVAFTLDEHKKFLNGIVGTRFENQFRLVLQTGLRTAELVGLRWENIDFEKRELTIDHTLFYRCGIREWVEGPPKSKSGYRTIPLTDEAIRVLLNQKKLNASIKVVEMRWRDMVFLSDKGEPPTNTAYDLLLYEVCRDVRIRPSSMHILRHTFATRCIESGMKPKTLQKILGHASITTTMNIYVTTTSDEKHIEMKSVSESLRVI